MLYISLKQGIFNQKISANDSKTRTLQNQIEKRPDIEDQPSIDTTKITTEESGLFKMGIQNLYATYFAAALLSRLTMGSIPVAPTPNKAKLVLTKPSAFSASIVQETSSSGKFFANTARANKVIQMIRLSCTEPGRVVKSSGSDGSEDDPVSRRIKSSLIGKLPLNC